MPADANGVADGEILKFNSDDRNIVWNSSIHCNTTWGGDLNAINKYLAFGGGGDVVLPTTIDATVESIIVANYYMMGFA